MASARASKSLRWHADLVQHGTYANPFVPHLTGPTAMVPPLHPLFLAALLRTFQTDAGMRIAAVFANIPQQGADRRAAPQTRPIAL